MTNYPGPDELRCARHVVDILFESTGLAAAVLEVPEVVVGRGNWISFSLGQAVGGEMLFALRGAGGKHWFTSVPFCRGQARSRTAPSLHLTNVDSGRPLTGHVDAYYWALNPWKHGLEFFLKQTEPPSVLLKLCARGR